MDFYTLYICLLYKSNKTIWTFYVKFDDERYNPVDNPNIYNVERAITGFIMEREPLLGL
jgi:hypothetical protein